MKKIVIVSGGMDSVTLLHDAVNAFSAKNIVAVTFKYGSKHSKQEYKQAKYNCKKLGVKLITSDLRKVFKDFKSALLIGGEKIPTGHYQNKNMIKTVVPNRNMILLSVAAGIAESIGADEILYGAHSGDHEIYPDCTKEFVNSVSLTTQIGTYGNIKITAPYWDIDKTKIIKKGLVLGVDYKHTWTCYSPIRGKACGTCGSCQERLEAFQINNRIDPLNYVSRILYAKDTKIN